MNLAINNNTRKLFLLLILCCAFQPLMAQQYGNEWINYKNQYYKFKIGQSGIYQIPENVLSAAGLASVPAEQFQLWHNGKQVALYSSTSSGQLGNSDYLEFYGQQNDGAEDQVLYNKPEDQLNSQLSLFTDTSAYYLTVNSSGGNLRYQTTGNDVSNPPVAPAAYFMYTARTDYRNMINSGTAQVVSGEYIYASTFDAGEGFSSGYIRPATNFNTTFKNLYLYTSGPAATLKAAAAGTAPNSRTVKVSVNGNALADSAMNTFDTKQFQLSVPLTNLSSNSNAINFKNTSSESTDRVVVSYVSLTYPRQFNFGGASYFEFSLPANNQQTYLEITNFSSGSNPPILYDLTNHLRLTANTATDGVVKILLPASSQERKLVLFAPQNNINTVAALHPKKFINYADAANQGDYLIITDSSFFDDGSGHNYVKDYQDYRSSADGDSYRAQVYTMDQLTDQFAYGIKNDPLAIRNFADYAEHHFAQPPKFVFLIGKGITYDQYRLNESSPAANQLMYIPTFGNPGSDNLLTAFGNSIVPQIPIGRISVIKPSEIANYLDKVKVYEQQLADQSKQTFVGRAWMKDGINYIGADDQALTDILLSYENSYKRKLEDTLYGANIFTFLKMTTDAVSQENNAEADSLFRNGLGLVTYFGHSAANVLAFNLNDPAAIANKDKYPLFIANGCDAGNLFVLDTFRLTRNQLSISENFVLTKDAGSIAFVASSNLGVTNILHYYASNLFTLIGNKNYGGSISEDMRKTIDYIVNTKGNSFLDLANAESINLDGDPAIKTINSTLPDYDIEQSQISVHPSIISISNDSVSVNFNVYNLGKAINDSLHLTVKRTIPDGTQQTLIDKIVPAPYYADSMAVAFKINPLKDVGNNKLVVSLDPENNIPETAENNNEAEKDFYINADEVRPVYPYDFSIINQNPVTLTASTDNPFAAQRNYIFEIDTTELFNSALLSRKVIPSAGGMLQYSPEENFMNNTVYYWRVAKVPSQDSNYIWNNSSFIYRPADSTGWNQSHYYQFLKDNFTGGLRLNKQRDFAFDTTSEFFKVETGCYPFYDYNIVDYYVNGARETHWGEDKGTSFLVAVINPINGDVWQNNRNGDYGSLPITRSSQESGSYEFLLTTQASRDKLSNFLNNVVPNGYYILIFHYGGYYEWANNVHSSHDYGYVNTWNQNDKNNLLTAFHSLGATLIDSFKSDVPYVFFAKKGDLNYHPIEMIGDSLGAYLQTSFSIPVKITQGDLQTNQIGPAIKWRDISWSGDSLNVNLSIQVIGMNTSGSENLLATNLHKDTSLAFINAQQYPYIKLQMHTADSINGTPYQLNYWRVRYNPAAEGALAPNIYFSFKDTLNQGEPLQLSLAFANVSTTEFDSLKVNLTITDRNNVPHQITLPRLKKLMKNDTLHINYTIDTKNYPGLNTLYVEVNPANDQPEQYHFNNIAYKQFYVKSDQFNPLMDVTFDGVHILNDDIVSALPHILINLKDENKYLALDDTSLFNIQVKYPDGVLHNYYFNNDTLSFMPADPSNLTNKNNAKLAFTPDFREDGEYELVVSAKDKSGNPAGQSAYRVAFNVINKPMISNLLNYPNPFTTSTAFVFTLTGSELPSQFKIEIMTITGKIVKVITKGELGPLHIGRNITAYKWDGTDEYGQKLANGIYLYRVVSSLNGRKMDLYKSGADQFITKGYGKMYLMR